VCGNVIALINVKKADTKKLLLLNQKKYKNKKTIAKIQYIIAF
jgi:hypothetical protein